MSSFFSFLFAGSLRTARYCRLCSNIFRNCDKSSSTSLSHLPSDQLLSGIRKRSQRYPVLSSPACYVFSCPNEWVLGIGELVNVPTGHCSAPRQIELVIEYSRRGRAAFFRSCLHEHSEAAQCRFCHALLIVSFWRLQHCGS